MEGGQFRVLLLWAYVHAGLSSPNSPWYLFWSGIGSDTIRILQGVILLLFTRILTRQHRERLDQAERHHRERLSDERGKQRE